MRDEELIRIYLEGNAQAFEDLIKKHYDKLKRFLWRLTKNEEIAEDLLHDSFLKAQTKIWQLQDHSKFKGWLYQIAKYNAFNKRRDEPDHDALDDLFLSVGSEDETNDAIDYKKFRSRLYKFANEELPYRQRVAFILRILYGYSFEEIAKRMDCPYDTAKANYRHALLKIKKPNF